MIRSLYFEEFEVRMKFISKGRTVTEADIVNFAGVSGDYNQLYINEQYAKSTIFGRRIAHGELGIALLTGFHQALGITEETMHATLGLEWDFVRPIFMGDTLHLELEVHATRETKKSDRGIVDFSCKLVNQHGEITQQGTRKMLVKRRPKEPARKG